MGTKLEEQLHGLVSTLGPRCNYKKITRGFCPENLLVQYLAKNREQVHNFNCRICLHVAYFVVPRLQDGWLLVASQHHAVRTEHPGESFHHENHVRWQCRSGFNLHIGCELIHSDVKRRICCKLCTQGHHRQAFYASFITVSLKPQWILKKKRVSAWKSKLSLSSVPIQEHQLW